MTKLVKIIICINLLLLLTGCVGESWPRFVYQPSYWTFANNRIELKDGYTLNEGHMYDIIETEDGYDMIFHFIKDDTNG